MTANGIFNSMYKIGFRIMCGCSLVLSACLSGSKPSVANLKHLELAGKVYHWAPEIDTMKREVNGGCDCCSGEIYFLNKTECVWVDDCESTITVAKGKYVVGDDAIEFYFGSKLASRTYNPEREVDTTAQPEYILEKQTTKAWTMRLKPIVVDNTVYLEFHDGQTFYAALTNNPLSKEIENLKTNGLWLLVSE